MKDKMTEEETHERAFWIVGIGIIVFLILLLGSIIGLKYTRENAEKVGEIAGNTPTQTVINNEPESKNYTVWEDGTKENVTDGIKKAQIDVDKVRFSSFSIIERKVEDLYEGEDVSISSTLSSAVENMNENVLQEGSYVISLFGENNNLLTKFSFSAKELPAREIQTFMHEENVSCVDAVKVEVEKVN